MFLCFFRRILCTKALNYILKPFSQKNVTRGIPLDYGKSTKNVIFQICVLRNIYNHKCYKMDFFTCRLLLRSLRHLSLRHFRLCKTTLKRFGDCAQMRNFQLRKCSRYRTLTLIVIKISFNSKRSEIIQLQYGSSSASEMDVAGLFFFATGGWYKTSNLVPNLCA